MAPASQDTSVVDVTCPCQCQGCEVWLRGGGDAVGAGLALLSHLLPPPASPSPERCTAPRVGQAAIPAGSWLLHLSCGSTGAPIRAVLEGGTAPARTPGVVPSCWPRHSQPFPHPGAAVSRVWTLAVRLAGERMTEDGGMGGSGEGLCRLEGSCKPAPRRCPGQASRSSTEDSGASLPRL